MGRKIEDRGVEVNVEFSWWNKLNTTIMEKITFNNLKKWLTKVANETEFYRID